MNLEAIALRRAEEQMQSRIWRRADKGEATGPKLCQVPGCFNPLPDGCGNRRTTCDACRDEGYAPAPCKACGGRIFQWEQRAVAKDRRGFCGSCRSGMSQTYTHDMSAAHAEVERRRAASRLAENGRAP